MQEVKSIRIVPTCVVIACVAGIIAVLTGIGLFIGGLVHGHVATGLFLLLIRPLLVFAATIVTAAISIWLYNLISPYVGWITYETAEKND
ncbi:MAG: hypothetical protein ACREQI_05135 [Candidatus Binataceae bacterium]